jgi:hypothetical protein
VSRRPRGKAREGPIAGHLTDEQHSHAGWIASLKCEVIFERALSKGDEMLYNREIEARIDKMVAGWKNTDKKKM